MTIMRTILYSELFALFEYRRRGAVTLRDRLAELVAYACWHMQA
jgi:hypothetical protein